MSARNSESEVLAQQLESVGSKILEVETRLTEVEAIITRLEAAARTMARGLEEVSSHWDAVYRAMRRPD
jgi:methyl-accepting chemotaxis protein